MISNDMNTDIYAHKFIILASYSTNSLGQIRSLGWKGIKPIVVFFHRESGWIEKSKYISEFFVFEDSSQGLDYVIKTYGNEPEKPFLYTDCDEVVGLFDKRYDELIDKFYFWNAGGNGRIVHYMDKSVQVKLAQQCGMLTPKTEVVKVGELPKTLSYPIYAKSVDSLSLDWKSNAFICNNEEELKAAYRRMTVESILLQEFIVKENEVPIEGISISGGEEIVLTVKSVNYRLTKESHGIFRQIVPFDDDELGDKIKQFVKTIGYTGVFGIEFLVDKKGRLFFLEINLRITQFNSGYAKFGVNLPYVYAKSVLSNKIAREEIHYTDKRPFNVMWEPADFKHSVILGDVSLKQWILDVKNTDCFQIYDKEDSRPFFAFLLYAFGAKITGIFSKKK